MKRIMISVLMAAVAVLLLAVPAAAQDNADNLSSQTIFNRELVNKVKKSCIYISAQPLQESAGAGGWIGSGVIIMALPEENAALALSNHHVANNTMLMQVETWDKRTYKGMMLTTDPGVDASLMKIFDIPPDAYEVAALGDSDNLLIGEPCLAVGAPGSREAVNINRSDPGASFGLHQSTTMGVVLGIEHSAYDHMGFHLSFAPSMGRQAMTNLPYRLVTQSAINGGNSGGPLFDADGELIGLNHAHRGYGGGNMPENFTIPVNAAKKLAFDYLDKGTYELPWFGMDVLIPPQMLTRNGLGEFIERYLDEDVIKVYGVRKGSPAERAGLQEEDIILEFDGRTFANVIDLRTYVFSLPIGKQVPVLVERGKREIEIMLEVGVKRSYNSEFSL